MTRDDNLLTFTDVMTYLRVSRTTLEGLIRKHGLPVSKEGREYRVDPNQLETWLKLQAVNPMPEFHTLTQQEESQEWVKSIRARKDAEKAAASADKGMVL